MCCNTIFLQYLMLTKKKLVIDQMLHAMTLDANAVDEFMLMGGSRNCIGQYI